MEYYDQEEEVVGFKEGRIWLPVHVLDDIHHDDQQQKPMTQLKQSAYRRPYDHHKQYYHHHQHGRRPKISLPGHDSIPRYDDHQQHQYPHHRPRFPLSTSRVSSTAGPGMQAVFLESGRRTTSCGTGFFLPQRAGNTTFQPNKKSTCSPVLLPSRVVQALNLNVHELGSQLTPRRDPSIKKLRDDDNKNGRDDHIDVVALDQSTFMCSVASQARSSSPEIFLPKEWTY